MVKNILTLGALAATLALLAGCGSSSKSSSSSSSAAAAGTTSTSSAPGSRYGAGKTTSTTAASTSGVTVSTKQDKLGTILAAGPKHQTVYLFEADKSGESACSEACAKAWPPVTTSGEPQVSGRAVQADLSTIMRSDGTKQVTYKGHPLYFFVKDEDAGDAYGEGSKAFGADWYVMQPSGAKIDNDEDTKGGSSDES